MALRNGPVPLNAVERALSTRTRFPRRHGRACHPFQGMPRRMARTPCCCPTPKNKSTLTSSSMHPHSR